MKVLKIAIKVILLILLLLLIITGVSYGLSRYGLMVSKFTLSSDKVSDPLRIVQITDLHNSVFGEDNSRLVSKISEQSPDIICITGDLINSNEKDISIALDLISKLKDIAPVYCSLGNHELEYEEAFDPETSICDAYEKAGAHVLEYGYEDIVINDNKVRIGGIYGYCIPAEYQFNGTEYTEEYLYLADFQDTDSLKILMCHMPLCWNTNRSLEDYDVDCVLAGHTHGGQIILPFAGGLYAPDRGFFIGREWGLYDSSDGNRHLILSRGLGSTEKIPRLNNIPEIVVIDYTGNTND